MTEPLNPLTLPLRGSRLIEASAGTGKTWTIAALYVRLVVGHGRQPLLPGEILVMTFTKAATRELSDRIRRRLVEAAAVFRGEVPAGGDGFLAALLDAFPDGPMRRQAAWRLAMAAEAMDDAAVHTIDAWCQRMLREHAFDSGCLFDEELQDQETALLAQAVRDHWREHVYPLRGTALDVVLAQWRDVDALAGSLKDLIEKPVPAAAGQGNLADAVAQAMQARADAVAALKAGWAERAGQMRDWLGAIWRDRQHPARKALPAEKDASRWLDALRTWALAPAIELPDLKTGAKRLTRCDLEERLQQAGAGIGVPQAFADLETLVDQLAQLPEVGPALRLHAAACVARRMQQLKASAGTFGFADMLNRLDAALDEALHGAKARRLRERILAQYPAALVDEFQDTSPVQLSIFDRLYRIADDEPSRVLLLIGDPKQAIYGFRGADIYSYLRARRATEGRHHALGTNHRSTQALVGAVNALFDRAEDRPGEGAFLFRQAGQSALPFVPVQARGRAERLVTSAGELAALSLVVDAPPRSKEDSRRLFAALCAEHIVGLLNDPLAGFEEADRPFRRLRPADVAVLVHSRIEAEAVRDEMRRRGLASVYLSDQDSVFRTPEAADLLRLLQAVASPRDVRLARAALATTLLGFTLPELVALSTDDERFDHHGELLQELALVWKGQGVLAMLRRALHAFDLPARWLAADDATVQGERRLTNVLHLAELLQAASARAEGEQALVRWLAQQVADAQAGLDGSEELVLRLESDADLVKVVTVHKSKGLEYPVVFLPFAAHFREVVGQEGEKNTVLLLPAQAGGNGERTLVLAPSRAQIELAEKERQRESLRLLYVALTRARHALWVGLAGVGKAPTWHRSAIGYLLSGPGEQPNEQRLHDALALAAANPGVQVQQLPVTDALPMPPATRLLPREEPPALVAPPAYAARFERNWSIGSYSTLVRDAAWATPGSGAVPRVVRDDEPAEPVTAPGTIRPPADQPWHRFPRGALAGNFLHDQLEWLAGERFALDASADLQQALARRCERQGWGHRSDDVVAWLRCVCATPLPALGAPLCTLATSVPETEFWFPSDGLQARQVDLLCQRHLQPGEPRPQLPERTLKGMLMGFADLVFEHGGRYWVLDYKSNALGTRDADYTREAMDAAMLQHRYDVQAALYLLALHRLLKARLGAAYQPAQHLGGAVYFFLRGVNSPTGGCCQVPPPLGLIGELDALLRQGAAATEPEDA